jgi:hypothetical protein
MIRTIPIPKTINRIGCTPRGGCCDECGGGHLGAAVQKQSVFRPSFSAVIQPDPMQRVNEVRRVLAMHHLGDTACDSDGNCYDTGTGQLLSAPLTTGPGCAPGIPSCAASSGSIGTAVLGTYLPAIIIGSVAALLLFTKGGR